VAYTGGPLSQSDLLALWQAVTDSSYSQAFIQAGLGNGLESYAQAFAQYERVSTAVDVSLQAMYILPWSGQSNPPASGPNNAIVSMTATRSGRLTEPLILGAGLVWFDEVAPDWSTTGQQMVNTGRRYTPVSDVVFMPGQSGPITFTAIAERPGYGYNNPQIGAISFTEQPGTQYSNVLATVQGTIAPPVIPSSVLNAQLVVLDAPDVVIPQHVGQYVTFTAGLLAGNSYRMTSYRPPNPPGDGGAVGLEAVIGAQSTGASGAGYSGPSGLFQVGEIAEALNAPGGSGIAYFNVVAASGATGLPVTLLLRIRSGGGALAAGNSVQGLSSKASIQVGQLFGDTVFGLTGASGVAWQVLDWVDDWGLAVANTAQPTGGTSDMLDTLGLERKMPRFTGEPDSAYRLRIATVSDVVTPNAMLRKLNSTLTTKGLAWTFREVGASGLPGFFYDSDFYDNDLVVVHGVSGASATGFFNGEKAYQGQTGFVTTGRAIVGPLPAIPSGASGSLYVNTPFVPGRPATTGIPNSPYLVGIANVRGPLIPGSEIVGQTSHAGLSPATATGGANANTQFRVYLDYLRFRAYFMVDIQRSDAGDFGFGWGAGASGVTGAVGALIDAFDTGPLANDFYDGYPLTAAGWYQAAYNALDQARAAGVSIEFFPIPGT
jgi:hypothetical protein